MPARDSTHAQPRPRRALVLDFDGTLADYGVVPPANVEALRRVRAAGNAVLLATGRPGCIVADDVRALCDGVITSAGANVRIGSRTLADVLMPEPLRARILEALGRTGADAIFECPDALVMTPQIAEAFLAHEQPMPPTPPGSVGHGPLDIRPAVRATDDLADVAFAKVALRAGGVPIAQLAEEIGPDVRALPSSIEGEGAMRGELQMSNIDKAVGLRIALDALGIAMADAVACGDGMNDLEMLADAGTAVVIEGAPEPVMAHADLVVPGPNGAGIAEAVERLGLA